MNTAALRIEDGADLRALNTLRVAARARHLIELADNAQLPSVLAHARSAALPLLVLGEGSNVLLTGDFDGIVLRLRANAMGVLSDDGTAVIVRAEAGRRWDELVSWSLAQGLGGIENLALIPGLCGAAPIQNIGAYGAELADTLYCVEAWDRQAATAVTLTHAQCRFGYRDSVFKQEPDRYIVTAIQLRLVRGAALRLDYAGIGEELSQMQIALPTAADVAEAVRRLRRRKLPQPDVLPNAGSFFKNPLVDAATLAALLVHYPQMPHWPNAADTMRSKLSAGWLIEQAGFKGCRRGDAGIAPGHALVLVNYGAANGAELLALARAVQAEVLQRFAVAIEPEPIII